MIKWLIYCVRMFFHFLSPSKTYHIFEITKENRFGKSIRKKCILCGLEEERINGEWRVVKVKKTAG